MLAQCIKSGMPKVRNTKNVFILFSLMNFTSLLLFVGVECFVEFILAVCKEATGIPENKKHCQYFVLLREQTMSDKKSNIAGSTTP